VGGECWVHRCSVHLGEVLAGGWAFWDLRAVLEVLSSATLCSGHLPTRASDQVDAVTYPGPFKLRHDQVDSLPPHRIQGRRKDQGWEPQPGWRQRGASRSPARQK
jgi:hypothetical protein